MNLCRLNIHKWGEKRWAKHGTTSGRSWFRDCERCHLRSSGFQRHGIDDVTMTGR